jgi:hypothetical protein
MTGAALAPRHPRLELLRGAAIGQADVLELDSVLGREWNNLGDLQESGVAKAEQEADARVMRQPL